MKLLRCKVCAGECNIIGNEKSVSKKIECSQCGFNNLDNQPKKEVIVLKKRKMA